jgi:hypothetical protein
MKLRTLVFPTAILLISAVSVAQLDKIVKGAGAAAIIAATGKDIDKALDKLLKHTDTASSFTKVVPIVSIGSGAFVGAAQVMGAKVKVSKVQAVGQLETAILGKSVRIKGLIPITTDKPGKALDRVDGVGVSGIIDLKL